MLGMKDQINKKEVLNQYIRSLEVICLIDYPKQFPELYDQIINLLKDQKSDLSIHTGLQGLLAVASRYEHENNNNKRLPLY